MRRVTSDARELAQYQPAVPEHFPELPATKLNMVQRLLAYVIAVFNLNDDYKRMARSYDTATSFHGARWADKALYAAKVKELAADNGDDEVIGRTSIADISRYVSWCLRKGGQAPSQIKKAAEQALLASRSQPAE